MIAAALGGALEVTPHGSRAQGGAVGARWAASLPPAAVAAGQSAMLLVAAACLVFTLAAR